MSYSNPSRCVTATPISDFIVYGCVGGFIVCAVLSLLGGLFGVWPLYTWGLIGTAVLSALAVILTPVALILE